MSDNPTPLTSGEIFEVVIEDPTDGRQHVFTGATEAEADAAADAYFNAAAEENEHR